jgi:predicted RNase H-related nuclease YkuK (DUF458 family)
MERKWRRLDGTVLSEPLEIEVTKLLEAEALNGNEMKVCIGTDSQVKPKATEFATVIVFVRKGKGGFMLINNEYTTRKMSIKERMLIEVARSIEIAYPLCGAFSRYNVEMELHVDINTNPHFKSNDAYKDAMSYILGMGFSFRAKPHAFASSSCANKIVQ